MGCQISKKGSLLSLVLLVSIAVSIAGITYLLFSSSLSSASDSYMNAAIILITISTLIAVVSYVAWEFSALNKLRRLLRKIAPMIDSQSAASIKDSYLEIYSLYMKLSEKHKQNFYTRVNSLREQIEQHMQSEREIETLLQRTDSGSLQEQKINYMQVYKIYQQLPKKVQERYYPQIVQLRDRLERGN
ncbi:MAG: hypothetical protein AABX05_05225 [Nanoarchaeota archaeon]